MNILRLSTLSLTAAVAVFALGYNLSFADKSGSVCEGHCSHGNDDGQEVTYSVTIRGDVVGNSGADNWVGGVVGKKSIGLNDAPPDELDVGAFINLDFFTINDKDHTSPFGDDGANCFGASDTIHQALIKRGKGGRAEAAFWFHGETKDGLQTVGYSLRLFGLFDPEEEWPPVNGPHLIMMEDWRTSVSNAGQDIKSMSCIDEGEDDITVAVDVTPQ